MLYMSSAKKLLLFSMLPCLFLVSCALSTMGNDEKTEQPTVSATTPVTDAAKRAPASKKFRLLTIKQIKAMPAKKVYEYYQKLFVFVSDMERFQNAHIPGAPTLPKKKSAMWILMEESFADAANPTYKIEIGHECLIGGYWGAWKKKEVTVNGKTVNKTTCDSENRCTTDTGAEGHKCNPRFFSYMDASSRKEFCVPLKNDLTQASCDATVKKFYDQMGPTVGADHFKRSLIAAVTAEGGEASEEKLRETRDQIYQEYQLIYNYCGETEADWAKLKASQDKSCFNLQTQYDAIESMVGEIKPDGTDTSDNAEQDEEIEVAASDRGDGLGKFSCIQSSLKQNGYPGVSNKYIAMFATASKYYADTEWANKKKTQRKASSASQPVRHEQALRSTIVSLLDIGLCKDTKPAANPYTFSGNSGVSESWLNSNKLPVTFVQSPEYADLFGLSLNQAIPWKSGPIWDKVEGNVRTSAWSNNARGTPPYKCVQESKYRIKTRKDLCEKMFKICGLPIDRDSCRLKNSPPDSGGSSSGTNNGGNDNGATTSTTNGTTTSTTDGGNDNGATNIGGSDTSSGGNAEVGDGNSQDAGHGGDGSSDMGNGPQ